MRAFHPLSTVEQLAAHLREEILRGHLNGTMPGVHHLVRVLGSSPNTVMGAVRLLEKQGLLENQGSGRRSRIVIPKGQRPPGLRLGFFLTEKTDLAIGYNIELKHQLQEAGHLVTYSPKYLADPGMDLGKVARHVKKTEADAWMVMAGTQPVLKWFAAQKFPTFAVFGRIGEALLAGLSPRKLPAVAEVVQRLVALGHRRIVLLVREDRGFPTPGTFETKFLEMLQAEGIRTGPYNLPAWEVSPKGLCHCLDSLFQVTPPTAIIFDEPPHFMAARQHLALRGITTPRDVSMICLDPDPMFAWSTVAVSHVFWDPDAMVRRVVQWADNVAGGKDDRRYTFLEAKFIEGGTIGAASMKG